METNSKECGKEKNLSGSPRSKSPLNLETESEYNRRSTVLASIVIKGITELVEHQCNLAKAFGLTIEQVFPKSFVLLKESDINSGIIGLFRGGAERASDLKILFDEMIAHQLALSHSLGTIAFSPMQKITIKEIGNLLPYEKESKEAWVTFKKTFSNLEAEDDISSLRLVGSSFIEEYTKTIFGR